MSAGRISASIGIAVARAGRARSLLHAADSAMYEAKSTGPSHMVTGMGTATVPLAA